MKSQLDKGDTLRRVLLEIRARLKAATPGPWAERRWNDDQHIVEAEGQDVTGWRKDHPESYIAKTGGWGYSLTHKNSTFIAHAPTDIANLIRALEKAVEQRDGYLDRLIERHGDGPTHGGKVADDAELSAILLRGEK